MACSILTLSQRLLHVMEELWTVVARNVVASTLRGKEAKMVAFQPPSAAKWNNRFNARER